MTINKYIAGFVNNMFKFSKVARFNILVVFDKVVRSAQICVLSINRSLLAATSFGVFFFDARSNRLAPMASVISVVQPENNCLKNSNFFWISKLSHTNEQLAIAMLIVI